jgi:serine/threonine protein kinase
MPEPSKHIGRYRILNLLGRGAMGAVYLADDPLLGRRVAIKVVAVDPSIQTRTRSDYLSRFASEAKASARLNHPSIVQIHDAGVENGEPWIAFQLVEGETLETILSKRRKLTLRRAVLFTLDISSALQHAHSWNIIHRDVKPANILVEPKSGIAMLADFGIAQAKRTMPVNDKFAIGSPGYMSPEQIDGKEVDQQSDLFSLGIVLYQMLSGEHPFLRRTIESTMIATCRGDYTPLRELLPDIPKQLDTAVRRCLFPNPKMRIRSAAELVGLLRPFAPQEAGADAGHMNSAATRIFVESRATSLKTGKTTIVGNVFYLLKIVRWYSVELDNIRKIFAAMMGRKDLFNGEVLEEAAGLVRSWGRRVEMWVTSSRRYVRNDTRRRKGAGVL